MSRRAAGASWASQASVAFDRSVAQSAQLWQRLTIRRTVRNLLRTDDVIQCRRHHGNPTDPDQHRAIPQPLIASQVPLIVSGNAHQNIKIARVGAPCTDFQATQKCTVDWNLYSSHRPIRNLQTSTEFA